MNVERAEGRGSELYLVIDEFSLQTMTNEQMMTG